MAMLRSFPIESLEGSGQLKDSKAPKLSQYLETIHARPAYKAALEKGGKYELKF